MTEQNHAYEQAAAQMRGVSALVAALGCDYDRLEELRDLRRPYTAGWNMPGYMPDTELAQFDDADTARVYIAGELEREADEIDEGADAIADRIAPECLNDAGMAGDYSEHDASAAQMREKAEQLRGAAKELRDLSGDLAAAEWGATLGRFHYFINYDASPGAGLDEDDAEELAELIAAAGDCEDQDDAQRRVSEDALSVEVRSGWHSLGESLEVAEFCILLCTGGPAVRILGELDHNGEPCRAWIEYQDWGTPWTEYQGEARNMDDLVRYAAEFGFGAR